MPDFLMVFFLIRIAVGIKDKNSNNCHLSFTYTLAAALVADPILNRDY